MVNVRTDSWLEAASEATLAELAVQFGAASPFPHLVIDDTLEDDSILGTFPLVDWDGWKHYNDEYSPQKMICSERSLIPVALLELIDHLSSPRALAAIEKITGIEQLLPDPYLNGGGLHCSGPGGVLVPHTDFHVYPKLSLFRRVNLLLYLNEDWTSADGGDLGLYVQGSTEPEVSVIPAFGRMVIFATDDRSVHGFLNPVAPERWRRSIALYYYTAVPPARYSGDTVTRWRRHSPETGVARARLLGYRGLLFGSRALSHVAHRVHPKISVGE
jgi:2OG-Fe(II) oxygenase superfamily